MEIHQKTSVPNNQKLKTMVKRCTDQKLLLRSFDARHWRIESGAVVRRRKGIIGVEGGKGLLPVERKRPVFVRRPLQFPPRHPRSCAKTRHLSRDRSVSRKRSIRGKSFHGSILRQPGRYYLKGTCTRTSCEYWHPPECQFFFLKKKKRVVRLETSVCFRTTRLMNNQIKKPKKEQHPKKKRQGRQERCACLWKAYHNWVAYHKTRMHSSLKERRSLGETRCRKSLNQFKGYDSLSLRNSQASIRERKDHRWEK